jgi:hypothetical protein
MKVNRGLVNSILAASLLFGISGSSDRPQGEIPSISSSSEFERLTTPQIFQTWVRVGDPETIPPTLLELSLENIYLNESVGQTEVVPVPVFYWQVPGFEQFKSSRLQFSAGVHYYLGKEGQPIFATSKEVKDFDIIGYDALPLVVFDVDGSLYQRPEVLKLIDSRSIIPVYVKSRDLNNQNCEGVSLFLSFGGDKEEGQEVIQSALIAFGQYDNNWDAQPAGTLEEFKKYMSYQQ